MELTQQARSELGRVASNANYEPGDVLRLRVDDSGVAQIEKGIARADDRPIAHVDGIVVVADAPLADRCENRLLHYIRDAGPLGSGKRWVLLGRRGGEARPGLARSVAGPNSDSTRNSRPTIPRLVSAVLHALR